MSPRTSDAGGQLLAALQVLTRTPTTAQYLTAHDPKALAQAYAALRAAGDDTPATPIPPTAYRVRFVYDEDASFEESNGEARPMTAAEYAGNEYRACPIHPRGLQGDKSGDKSEHGRGWCACGREYENVPYAEYLAYYGNPERHVYLGCQLQRQCAACSCWQAAGSLWSIDFMDDNREYLTLQIDQWYAPDDPALVGYAREVAAELISEAQ